MGTLDQNTLRSILQNLEREAHCALGKDVSFLEVLQCLKWQVDSDTRVKAATLALRDRGLRVFSSFVPRIRIRLLAGETMLALPRSSERPNGSGAEDLHYTPLTAPEPLLQELRDAARAVVAGSLHCRQLDGIVNEAVQANFRFEKIAEAVEFAGYEVQICLDLSTYAQVREQGSTRLYGHQTLRTEIQKPKQQDPDRNPYLPLSSRDLQFLMELRIRPD